MSDDFRLDSGRLISIATISIRSTYEGFLEGDPDFISNLVWQRTPEELRREFGDHVLILKPLEPHLPCYRFVAVLHSSPLLAEIPEDYSYMTIAWFQSSLKGNLVALVQQATKRVDWEEHAKNWTM